MEFDNEDIGSLEKLLQNEKAISFDPDCVRKKSNWGRVNNAHKFDDEVFSKKTLLKDIPTHSPKLETLLKKIEELDKKDRKKHGKMFKHFIFSDLKFANFGAKLLASALIAKGMNLGYTAELKNPTKKANNADAESNVDDDEKQKKRYKKIEMIPEDELLKTKYNNFYLLTSTSVYDQNLTTVMKKHVLKTFNQRPDNVYGELARIIIMDSGFKEGIDLFDIKYIHIFEPSLVSADQKQVIGRGTRTCGQKGLEFHPTRGWPLYVHIYDLSIPEQLRPSFLGSDSAMGLYLKTMNIDVRRFRFNNDLEKTSIYGSVDYELNKNIHTFSIPFASVEDNSDDSEIPLPDGAEFVYGGDETPQYNGGTRRRLRIVDDLANKSQMGFQDTRAYIDSYYGEYEWDAVKMENLCKSKMNGGTEVIKYTPTQEFVRHYFTPANPRKGLLLWNSVGTGKTATAIATATSGFEQQGYTILWVTRTTLKNDIWKNMFEQVCNQRLRYQIRNSNLVIPQDQNKRMKLLSNAWRIRPMSYKQFSNLVSKKNDLYKRLVKINGDVDPLRKTLLIIDEAHKLYGGGLSSIEQPDMNVFHQSLMNSYQVSGNDSVKLLLMTATPIANDPMELIQLLNLCRPRQNQIPSDFDEFSDKYLDEIGEFTKQGRDEYLDDIAGYISYLNREKDARQFSQPIIETIYTPIVDSDTMEITNTFDKKFARDLMTSDIPDLKNKMLEAANNIDSEINDVDKNTFKFVAKEICKEKSGDELKICEKISKKNISQMVSCAKEDVAQIREQIKEIREMIRNKNLLKSEKLAGIQENIQSMEGEYDEYKGTLIYNIKNKCGIKVDNNTDLKTQANKHPELRKLDEQIMEYDQNIKSLQDELKYQMATHKSNIERLKKALTTIAKTDIEKSVVRMNIKDARKDNKTVMRVTRKDVAKREKLIRENIKRTQKERADKYKLLRKTVKLAIASHKKDERDIQRMEKQMRKTLRKQEDYKEEIKNDFLKNIVNKYTPIIKQEVATAIDAVQQKNLAKQKIAEEKQRNKEEKRYEKERKTQERVTRKAVKEKGSKQLP